MYIKAIIHTFNLLATDYVTQFANLAYNKRYGGVFDLGITMGVYTLALVK